MLKAAASGMRIGPKKPTRTRNYGPVKKGDSRRVSDSTLFARVGAILFEGLPAARRVKIDGPEGDSMVSPGRTGTGYHGYGKFKEAD